MRMLSSAQLIGARHKNSEPESSDFESHIIKQFGSVESAAAAKADADAVFNKYGEWPADSATAAESAIFERWDAAVRAATMYALRDWAMIPDGAYFDIVFWEMP